MQALHKEENAPPKKKTNPLYKTVWRWHFYAGMIFAPFLIILAFTGAIYLFKPQIEAVLYQDYYDVTPQGEKMAASEQVELVKDSYPNATVTSYRPGEDPGRSSEVNISTENGTTTVFLNPYTGESLGTLDSDDRIMDKIEEFHGELMAGTTGDRIVELAACWAVVLLVTGLYLWFPKKKKNLRGTLIPRFTKKRKIVRRDLHAIPAFWIAAGMLFLIMTGLPWSGFWGTNFQNAATNTGEGYPPSIWTGSAPTSDVETQDIADVPWAAETLPVPESDGNGLTPVSIDDVVSTADQLGVHPSYTAYFPADQSGVFTLSAFPPKAQDEATVHIDQYSGAVIADYQYENYGWIGKVVAWGITLHKGTQFGIINQVISLLICLGIIFVAVTGFYLWWKRKPKEGLGAPKAPPTRTMRGFVIVLIALGILFPLVGLTLVIVWLVDWLVIQRVPRLKRFFHA